MSSGRDRVKPASRGDAHDEKIDLATLDIVLGMWRLSFSGRKDGDEEAGAAIEKKWREYEGAWKFAGRLAACRAVDC